MSTDFIADDFLDFPIPCTSSTLKKDGSWPRHAECHPHRANVKTQLSLTQWMIVTFSLYLSRMAPTELAARREAWAFGTTCGINFPYGSMTHEHLTHA